MTCPPPRRHRDTSTSTRRTSRTSSTATRTSRSGNGVNFGTHEETAGGTQKIDANFRADESDDEAAEDDAQVITANRAAIGALPYRKEPETFITELAKKHATDHKYIGKVLCIMKRHTSSHMTRRRSLALLLPCAALVAATFARAEPCPIPRHPVTSADQAVDLSRRAIETYRLTDTPLRCLAVEPQPDYKGAGYEIDVRENHIEGCGDALPMFSPRVMSIHVTAAGVLTSTAGASDARLTYRGPTCPRPEGHATDSRH